MRLILLAAATAALAACSEAAPEPEATEQAAAPAPTPAAVLAADGQPSVGKFQITTSKGEVIMEEVKADGTYVDTIDGKVVETGKWEQKSPEQYCFTKDEEGATQECNTEAVDANGVWTSRNAEGEVATVVRVTT